MKASFIKGLPPVVRAAFLIFGAVLVLGHGVARAQAPAGPMPAHPQADAPPPQAPASTQSQSEPAKIGGTWKLNKDQSDDARKAMQAAGGGAGGGGGRGGYGGGGGGGMGGGRRGGGGGRGGQGGMMEEFNQLTIVQSASAVKISGASGRVLAQSPAPSDDKSKSSSSSDGSNYIPTGEWQGSQYVVTTQNDRGKTTRTFAVTQDGSQLTMTTRIDSPRFDQPVTFRCVYDPVKGSSGSD